VKPAFESKNDYEFLYLLARKLGFADELFKAIKVENNVPLAEDILREINRGGWSTGYCGQSPERLKAHIRNQHVFDIVTLRAPKDAPEVGGDYYGLPCPVRHRAQRPDAAGRGFVLARLRPHRRVSRVQHGGDAQARLGP
jgi:formate dehydrogenase major subunit